MLCLHGRGFVVESGSAVLVQLLKWTSHPVGFKRRALYTTRGERRLPQCGGVAAPSSPVGPGAGHRVWPHPNRRAAAGPATTVCDIQYRACGDLSTVEHEGP